MSAHEELLAAVRYVRDRTGDPVAWQTGLSPRELAAVVSPTTRPDQLHAIAGKIRQQHSGPSGPRTPGGTRPPEGPAAAPEREQGEAAEAIARAEAALAHQNSTSSQLDMQVVTAILNAHLNAVEGSEALTRLQRETEAAVRTRSDLDTPAGARDFQRFLIGKLRDIRAVVLNASLDDTSKSALMAAWTSLYDASNSQSSGPDAHAAATGVDAAPSSEDPEDDGWDPLLESLLADDPGLATDDLPTSGATQGAIAPEPPVAPMMPTIPNFASGLPGFGGTPGSMAGWDMPGGSAIPGLQDRTDPASQGLEDDGPLDSAEHTEDASSEQDDNPEEDASTVGADSAPSGPTTITLPDGETVTAASPQLAEAIKAAVGGAPIPDAFQQQGITIPAPGSAVAEPIDPIHVTPADIGIFTDRHALALGPGKALLDGQIQDIAAVSGPSFLGWEHPPAAAAAVTAPAKPDTPTPTRPASSSTT